MRTSIGKVVGYSVLGVVLVSLLIWKIKTTRKKFGKRSLTDVMMARFKIALGFYQVSCSGLYARDP